MNNYYIIVLRKNSIIFRYYGKSKIKNKNEITGNYTGINMQYDRILFYYIKKYIEYYQYIIDNNHCPTIEMFRTHK